MHLRLLQAAQRPWLVNTFEHALHHVHKAAGRLSAFVDDFDHALEEARVRGTDSEQEFREESYALPAAVAPFLADLVTCALKLAKELPSGPVDLEAAVEARMREKGILHAEHPDDAEHQAEIDAKTRRQAEEIVDAQKVTTINDARRFAVGWIEVALQHVRNEGYWRDRAERGERKVREAFDEVAAGLERERLQRADLAVVATETEGVWRWQGDGGDFPESLSCPVVMSAETLRELLRSAEPPFKVACRKLEDGRMTAVVNHHTMPKFEVVDVDGAVATRRVEALVLRRLAELVEGESVVVGAVDRLFQLQL